MILFMGGDQCHGYILQHVSGASEMIVRKRREKQILLHLRTRQVRTSAAEDLRMEENGQENICNYHAQLRLRL
jgi:hypothetical protein